MTAEEEATARAKVKGKFNDPEAEDKIIILIKILNDDTTQQQQPVKTTVEIQIQTTGKGFKQRESKRQNKDFTELNL